MSAPPDPAWRRRTPALATLLALVGIAGLLLFAPTWPAPGQLRADLLSPDGFGHFAIFAAFGLVVPWVFPRVPRVLLFEALLLVAGATELVQYLVPERDPSWSDLVANAAGTLAALLPLPRERRPSPEPPAG